MVPDHHLLAPLTEAGVDVKGNVVASQKVHREPAKATKLDRLPGIKVQKLHGVEKVSLHFSVWFDVAEDGHHHLVIHTSGQVQVIWHTLIRRQQN